MESDEVATFWGRTREENKKPAISMTQPTTDDENRIVRAPKALPVD
jgi:hypothetical protein